MAKLARPTWLNRKVLTGVAAAVFIAVVFLVVLPQVADYRDVIDIVKDYTAWEIAALVVVAALNVATFAPPWQVALPGLGFRAALALTLASTASTYIAPGGAAVGAAFSFAMLRGWGFKQRAVTLCVAVTGIWSQLVIFGMPVIALAALTLEGATDRLLRTVALVGAIGFVGVIVAFALSLRSAKQARIVGDFAAKQVSRAKGWIRRKPVGWSGQSWVRFRWEAFDLLKRRWHVLTLATIAGHATVYLVLLVALLASGVNLDQVTIVESFAAWSLVRLISSIPITPGGFGIIELGLTSALVSFGGDQAGVVAAVLVYRALTVLPPLILGLLAMATWRRHHPGWEQAVEEAEPVRTEAALAELAGVDEEASAEVL